MNIHCAAHSSSIIAVGSDARILVWHVEKQSWIQRLVHSGLVTILNFSLDGTRLLSGSCSTELQKSSSSFIVWDVSNPMEIVSLGSMNEPHAEEMLNLYFLSSPIPHYMNRLSRAKNEHVQFASALNEDGLGSYVIHDKPPVMNVQEDVKDLLVLSASKKELKLWTCPTKHNAVGFTLVHNILYKDDDEFKSVHVSMDSLLVFVGTASGLLRVWKVSHIYEKVVEMVGKRGYKRPRDDEHYKERIYTLEFTSGRVLMDLIVTYPLTDTPLSIYCSEQPNYRYDNLIIRYDLVIITTRSILKGYMAVYGADSRHLSYKDLLYDVGMYEADNVDKITVSTSKSRSRSRLVERVNIQNWWVLCMLSNNLYSKSVVANTGDELEGNFDVLIRYNCKFELDKIVSSVKVIHYHNETCILLGNQDGTLSIHRILGNELDTRVKTCVKLHESCIIGVLHYIVNDTSYIATFSKDQSIVMIPLNSTLRNELPRHIKRLVYPETKKTLHTIQTLQAQNNVLKKVYNILVYEYDNDYIQVTTQDTVDQEHVHTEYLDRLSTKCKDLDRVSESRVGPKDTSRKCIIS